ncbi:branched-chain amino acid ABC transporter permease [Prosthecodimorpha staleyi]|uniref:Branched-chain amino acid ABC transporter permease n=1 Tax=Prosthecodimorpha staleyi TaxID=2840188 RepID=A0A947GCE0_9HYPH|nr:branched-chain amino acid ABC transporter permease [Prosthecodimorpha staleyi]MBT9289086.1 branched-chain amino acid ABC transporter permease [Prosthecodimorpha staleyi]
MATAPAANDNTRPSRLGPFLRSPAFGLVLVALLAAAPAAAILLGQPFWLTMATRVAIFALAALSLAFILGQGGLVSFGHAAPFGIGAYAVLILADLGIADALVAFPVAFLAGALFSGVTGTVALRTRGVYFIMITLALAQMAFFTFTSLSAYGGDDGMTLWARSTVAGQKWLKNDLTFAYLAIGLLALFLVLGNRVLASRFGRVFRGLKENESRLAALGYDAYPVRLVAYALAGGVAAVAGALLANQTEFVSPAYMAWQRSGDLIVMVVLGGLGPLHGAIVGAAVVLVVEETLSHLTEHWKIIFGPLLILIVLLRGGLIARLLGGRRG